MIMKYALFPGCVLEGAAAEAYTSLNKVCDKLGIEIEEIPTGLAAARLMHRGSMTLRRWLSTPATSPLPRIWASIS